MPPSPAPQRRVKVTVRHLGIVRKGDIRSSHGWRLASAGIPHACATSRYGVQRTELAIAKDRRLAMTSKSDFTTEEWQLILEAPPIAGMFVVTAQRGGSFRETIAMAKSYVEARQ